MKKFGEDKSRFISFLENKDLQNELVNASDRDAVLTGTAVLDTLLERLLSKFLVQEPNSMRLTEKTYASLNTKISACYSLGLIGEEEKHDLNIIREVRNAFSHNVFGCSFGNQEVSSYVANLKIPRRAGATPENIGLRPFFLISIYTLESMLNHRITVCKSRVKCGNFIFNGK